MIAKTATVLGTTGALLSMLTPNPMGVCTICTLLAVTGILGWPNSSASSSSR